MQPWMTIPNLPLAADQIYWSRPSLELIRAYNLATFSLLSREQPALAVVSASAHAVELLKRSPFPLSLAGTGAFNPQVFAHHLSAWAWGELQPVELDNLTQTYDVMVWAEPQLGSAAQVAARLYRQARRSCSLDVLVTAGSQSASRLREGLITARQVQKNLVQAGWQLDQMIAFYGPRARFWQFLADRFERVKFYEWSDRCNLMLQSQMKEPGWLWRVSRLALIRARKI